ncbi:MAG: SWIM zinc finger family protein [Acidaminobacteraceae bacterium]
MIYFEHLFKNLILERAYDYFASGLIKELEYVDDEITARVDGSSLYDVRVTIVEECIEDMFCDCPYFSDGNNCKHIAAVLYAVNNKHHEIIKEEDHKSESFESILDRLSKEELIDFLKKEMKLDDTMINRFSMRFHTFDESEMLSAHLEFVESLLENYTYPSRFVEYYEIRDYEASLHMILESIESLFASDKYEIIFMMIKSVIEKIAIIELDDSFGTTTMILESLMKNLRLIIDKADEKIYNMIFEWTYVAIDSNLLGDLNSYITIIFMDNFKEEDKLKKKIKLIERIISKIDNNDSWNSRYEITIWVTNKIQILTEQSKNHEVEELIEEYLYLNSIRRIYIDKCIVAKDYGKAIMLLLEGKIICADTGGSLDYYSEKLIEIYKITKNKEKLLEECEKRLFEYSPSSLNAYLEYKSLFQYKVWESLKHEVIENLKNDSVDIKPHLMEEKLFGELLLEIKTSPYWDDLTRYEEVLYNEYKLELLELFKKKVISMAESSGNRNHYKSIIREIKHIKTYPSGEDVAKKLIELFSNNYKNRSAMLDEFRKAKMLQ